MGIIRITAGLVIFLIIASTVIAILPENLFGLELTPIHRLKSSMFYVYGVLFYFLLLVGTGIGLVSLVKNLRQNRIVKDVFMFLLYFDDKSWKRLRANF
jgi:hypothetical protein